MTEFVKNMGFQLKNDAEAYSFKNFVKEMFFDSETTMVVISGVPGREELRDKDGKVLEGAPDTRWVRKSAAELADVEARKEINDLAGSQRALYQGNLAPNHYWDKTANAIDKAQCLEQMERELKVYGISSWKWYCHTDPARTGNGFQLDDDNAQWFIEESRKRGMKLISVHKGYSYQSRTLGHLANPKDVEKAALRNPDFNFVVYHSAIKHGSSEPDWIENNKYDPTTGDFEWHNVLMDIKKRNPKMNNVYCEIGSFFNTLAIVRSRDVHARHGQEHQVLRRRSRDLGHRLPVVGLAAVGHRRLQALPDLRRDVREVRLQEDSPRKTRRRSSG